MARGAQAIGARERSERATRAARLRAKRFGEVSPEPWRRRKRAGHPPSRRSRFGASSVALAEAEAGAARERAWSGVRGAKPLGLE